MRSKLFRLLLTAGLGAATLAGTADVTSAQPTVRDHRKNPGRRPAPPPPQQPQADRGPREAPPPPREERQAARRGYVWASGEWDWKGGKWEWTPGHWEREKRGNRWRAARWELKGGEIGRAHV